MNNKGLSVDLDHLNDHPTKPSTCLAWRCCNRWQTCWLASPSPSGTPMQWRIKRETPKTLKKIQKVDIFHHFSKHNSHQSTTPPSLRHKGHQTHPSPVDRSPSSWKLRGHVEASWGNSKVSKVAGSTSISAPFLKYFLMALVCFQKESPGKFWKKFVKKKKKKKKKKNFYLEGLYLSKAQTLFYQIFLIKARLPKGIRHLVLPRI